MGNCVKKEKTSKAVYLSPQEVRQRCVHNEQQDNAVWNLDESIEASEAPEFTWGLDFFHTIKSVKELHSVLKNGRFTILVICRDVPENKIDEKFKDIIIFGIAINITAAIGSFIFSYIDDYFGPKKIILVALFFLIILSFLLIIIQDIFWVWVLGVSLGVFIGPIQSSSRSAMILLSNPKKINEMFGMYALSGKSTAFLGPFLVGSITSIYNSQRIGMASILIFLLIGFFILIFTNFKKFSD